MKLSKNRLKEIIKEELIKEFQVGDGEVNPTSQSRISDKGGTKTDVNKDLSVAKSYEKENEKDPTRQLSNLLGRIEGDTDTSEYYPPGEDIENKKEHIYKMKSKEDADRINKSPRIQQLIKAARKKGVIVTNNGNEFKISYP